MPRLPALRAPQNALLNFDGLSNALKENGRVRRQTEQQEFQRRQLAEQQARAAEQQAIANARADAGLDLQRQGFELRRSGQEFNQGIATRGADRADQMLEINRQKVSSSNRDAAIKKIAGVAQLIDGIQDPVKREAVWNRYGAENKELFDALPPEVRNPIDGPKFLIAEALGPSTPRAPQFKTVKGDIVRINGDGTAEKVFSGPESPFEQLLKNSINQNSPGGRQPSAGLQNQSFSEDQPQLNPGVVLTAGDTPTAPQAPAPQDNMITVPGMGKFTRQQAESLAAAAAVEGNSALSSLFAGALNPASGGEGLQKPTKNALEKNILNSSEGLERIGAIDQGFKPEFLTIPGKIGFAIDHAKAMVNPDLLSDEQKTELGDFAVWRQNAWDNANRYIKEITGAQMSEAEAARLLRAMPDPGTSPFTGDNAVSFQRKLKGVQNRLRLALVRNHYLRKKGFQGSVDHAAKQLSIDGMKNIVTKRANELFKQMKSSNPRATNQQLKLQTQKLLRSEFGIGI